MRFEKTSGTELRRTAEAVAREGSIRKASMALVSSATRSAGAWPPTTLFHRTKSPMVRALSVPRAPYHWTRFPMVHPSAGAPSDQASNGAQAEPAFTPPPGSYLHWHNLTADENCKRVAEDGRRREGTLSRTPICHPCAANIRGRRGKTALGFVAGDQGRDAPTDLPRMPAEGASGAFESGFRPDRRLRAPTNLSTYDPDTTQGLYDPETARSRPA